MNILKILLVGIAHIILGVLFYSCRMKTNLSVFKSDWFVFALPALMAFGGYFGFLWKAFNCGYLQKIVFVFPFACCLIIISCILIAIIAFNQFGT